MTLPGGLWASNVRFNFISELDRVMTQRVYENPSVIVFKNARKIGLTDGSISSFGIAKTRGAL
jgi:hypothetical protein